MSEKSLSCLYFKSGPQSGIFLRESVSASGWHGCDMFKNFRHKLSEKVKVQNLREQNEAKYILNTSAHLSEKCN